MEPSHFRVTRVRLKQYRSFAEADVRLEDLVFLVGPNGAGKSNFLDALRLVSEGIGGSLEEALRERGGAAQVRRRAPGHPDRFSVRLSFEGPGGERGPGSGAVTGTYGVQIAGKGGSGSFRIVRERCEVTAGGVRSAFRVEDGELTASTERKVPAPAPGRLLLADLGRHKSFAGVHAGLAGFRAFSLDPAAMRGLAPPRDGRALLRDGTNAGAVLHRLGRVADGADRRRLDGYLQRIVPGLRGTRRRVLDGAETVEFAQDTAGAAHPWKFTAPSVSDGTLRALGVLLALFAPAGGRYGPVAIEEPETALHPAAAAVVREALRDAADRRQVLVTSHSPDLLDHEEVDAGSVRAVRAEDGRSVIGVLDEPAAFALRAGLDTAGHLLRTDGLVPRPALAADSDDAPRAAQR
ncbi:Predicted ATPase [Actinacidiphila yanglinensis]|uniref:Predicted ATPase n=1 Tax=Actinacidiphila yanglinensis TaxID=310779 RepID=A0A1H5XFG3_9ACTN|nr:AAA family ATPase [Actinacidiphila yanglinensis]SEG10554.1 Predicted ATPase [Actinacidiphila yanglinensis]